MALIKGTNSYVTVAEADTYFEGRLDAAAWMSASEDMKEQALITATSVLDNMEWTGVAVSDSQNLAFPRIGVYFDPRLGSEVTFDSLLTPKRVITATYEMAYHLLNNDGLLDDTGKVVNLEVGRIKLSNVSKPNTIPSTVKQSVKPMLNNMGSGVWWRAN